MLSATGLPLPRAAAPDATRPADAPFAGFWMGGYEGADPANGAGHAFDPAHHGGHLDRLEEDHRRAAQMGLRAVRESIGWRLAEDGDGHIDLGRALRVQASARRHGLQVLWTLVHQGLPQGLGVDDDAIVPRLARFAAEVARVLGRGAGARPPVFTPIHEIGSLAADGGGAVRRRLVQAALAAMAAIARALPQARFLHPESLASGPWQTWDLLAGRTEPALGGHARWLDVVGVGLPHDLQGRRLHRLLTEVWLRYHRPLLVLDAGAADHDRAARLHEIASELRQAQAAGLPVQGLCLSPLVDHPDAQQPKRWQRGGLWHVDCSQPSLPRRVEPGLRDALRRWQQVLPQPLPRHEAAAPRVLLAYSDRPWDLLRHRTRHLLQGLAEAGRGWRVVVVEAPRQAARARLDSVAGGPHLQVLVPHTPGTAGVFHPGPCLALQRLLGDWLATEDIRHHTVWLATPMAAPLARALRPQRVVYDCIDEPSGSPDAPAGLAALEADLLATADRVLVASAALAAPRVARAGARLHVLPNGVDDSVFRAPRRRLDEPASRDDEDAALAAAPLWQAAGPQLGYAGAIDARLDLALLAQLADARPHWQLVMLGPVLGLDPTALPRRPNLHWLGAVPYRLLPSLMAHWQLALLPFVRSAGTWRARPPKVLEALAMGLPVVAAPLPELAPLAAAGVTPTRYAPGGTALDASAFLRACEAVLAEDAAAAAVRRRAAARAVRSSRWADAVRQLCTLLEPAAPEDPRRLHAVAVAAHAPARAAVLT